MSRGQRRQGLLGRFAALSGTALILSSILMTVGATAVLALDTGAKTAGATLAPNDWTNPGNASADDGAYATVRPPDSGDRSQGYSQFNFGIPNGSIIDGITVKIEAKSTDSSNCQLDVRISGNGGSTLRTKTINLTGADAVSTVGGATDTWGQVWDPTQLTNANFRVQLRALDGGSGCNDADAANNQATASVDYFNVLVSYRTMTQHTNNPALSGTVCKSGDFDFIIDMSGSIGAQGNLPSNLQQLKDGINGFVNAFQGAGGDGRYAGTKFSGSSASNITSGFQAFGTFQTAVNALSGPSGLTPTGTGITTGAANTSGDRAGVPNVMFVLTDGSPNKPNTHSDDLNVPETWLQGANGAVGAANAARAAGFVVEAVYLSTPQDPGDTSLPFSAAGDSAWATEVMDEIGGGDHFDANFNSFVDDLFAAIDCPPPPPADIHIVKTANPSGPVNVGSPIGFDITISNTGQGAANDVTIHDDLPAGAGLDWSLDPAFTGCAISGPVGNEDLDCSFASLGSGASKGPIHVKSNTAKADCGAIDNTATVDAANDDPASNPASVVVQCPDVSVVKTPDNGKVNAGSNAVFSILVANAGPGSATGVTLSDPLPAGYTWTTGGADAASCSIASNTLSCNFGTVPANGTRTVTLTAPTTGQNCAVIPNTATVGATNEKAAGANNTDSASIDVLCGNVGIVKVANPVGPVSAGSDIGFDITVSNTGDGAANAVHMTDNLPAGIAWTADAPTGSASANCSIDTGPSPDVLTCDAAAMAADTTFKVHIHGTTDAADCGTVNNSATVSSGNDGGGTSSASVTVQCPNIDVSKTADHASVSAGSQIGFTVTIANNGSGTATGLAFSDALPGAPGVDWSIDGSPAGWSISGAAPNQSLVYAPSTLAGNTTRSVHVVSHTTADSCATYDNTASLSAANDEGGKDSASTVVQCPDVHVEKTAPIGTISAGDVASFTIVVSNSGPGVATAVTLTDDLPSGVAWTEDSDACAIAAGVMTCDFGNLASGASATVHVTGATDAADCGTLTNTAVVSATNEPKSASEDDSSSATIAVECPDLSIVKTAIDDSISAGELAGFKIVASNAGPGAATDVVISDSLPSGIDWIVDDTDHCAIAGGVLTCSYDSIAAGDHVTVTVSGETSVEDCGSLQNTATVSAANAASGRAELALQAVDPLSSSATIAVDCADVVITKTADAIEVVAGAPIGFTVEIKNTGAGTAFGVTASDPLPAGLAWAIDPASDGWTIDGGVLTFGPASLAGGASTSVHVIATTDRSDCGVVQNTATFSYADGGDSDSSDVSVRCPGVDLDKTTTDADGQVEPNQTVSYGITVSVTDGPVTNAVVTDSLPAGQTYIASSQSSTPAATFAVSSDGRTLTWTFASLSTGESAATISYDVTIDADASTAPQANEAEVCVAEKLVDCASDEVVVIPQTPAIHIVKRAGDAADGAVFSTGPGAVTYSYLVTNTGPLALSSIVVTDDNGTPGETGDDFAATCPKTTLAADESMTCTSTVDVIIDTTNIAVVHGITAGGNSASDEDDAVVDVLQHGLTIDKSNDAPVKSLEMPDGTTADLPTANEGDTVVYTLAYTFSGDPVSNAVITDVLPEGLQYTVGSATSDDQFTFVGYDELTRTLSWSAESVTKSGSLTYSAVVLDGANELSQPLTNVATIISDQTEPDSDTSDVFVPVIPQGETHVPTAPPTDTIEPTQTSDPGFGLPLILAVLGALILTVGIVTPVPAPVRRRNRR